VIPFYLVLIDVGLLYIVGWSKKPKEDKEEDSPNEKPVEGLLLILLLLKVAGIVLYIVERITLIGQMFALLRVTDPGIHNTVPWTQYLPHIN
jgi:hypothetical protein